MLDVERDVHVGRDFFPNLQSCRSLTWTAATLLSQPELCLCRKSRERCRLDGTPSLCSVAGPHTVLTEFHGVLTELSRRRHREAERNDRASVSERVVIHKLVVLVRTHDVVVVIAPYMYGEIRSRFLNVSPLLKKTREK